MVLLPCLERIHARSLLKCPPFATDYEELDRALSAVMATALPRCDRRSRCVSLHRLAGSYALSKPALSPQSASKSRNTAPWLTAARLGCSGTECCLNCSAVQFEPLKLRLVDRSSSFSESIVKSPKGKCAPLAVTLGKHFQSGTGGSLIGRASCFVSC